MLDAMEAVEEDGYGAMLQAAFQASPLTYYAGTRWFWKNSDESQHWRYTQPPLARPQDLVVEQLYAAPEES
jgi:hypothetical protein